MLVILHISLIVISKYCVEYYYQLFFSSRYYVMFSQLTDHFIYYVFRESEYLGIIIFIIIFLIVCLLILVHSELNLQKTLSIIEEFNVVLLLSIFPNKKNKGQFY